MHFGETSDAVHVRVREGVLDRGLWEMAAAVSTGHRLDAAAVQIANTAQCAQVEEHRPDQGREERHCVPSWSDHTCRTVSGAGRYIFRGTLTNECVQDGEGSENHII